MSQIDVTVANCGRTARRWRLAFPVFLLGLVSAVLLVFLLSAIGTNPGQSSDRPMAPARLQNVSSAMLLVGSVNESEFVQPMIEDPSRHSTRVERNRQDAKIETDVARPPDYREEVAQVSSSIPLSPLFPWASEDGGAESIAWGDVNGDGFLDLATVHSSHGTKIYMNRVGVLEISASWTITVSGQHIAWGDVEGDGDLDLAIVGDSAVLVHLNQSGHLNTTPSWSSVESAGYTSASWGDVDGDGDLDLAVGNASDVNTIYLNLNGTLGATPSWWSEDNSRTMSVTWGDVDGDGDLDLAAGNTSRNRVYRNDNGSLDPTASWISSDNLDTMSVAWGDVDGDGDIDLAAGNDYQDGDRVYYNHDGTLEEAASWWQTDRANDTNHVAWGDVDGDGDLDLATASPHQSSRVYLNHDGVLESTASWLTYDTNRMNKSVAWGDVDGDGDLELAVGSEQGATKVYMNLVGPMEPTPSWASSEDTDLHSAAWGDVDNDGDLDLAIGDSIGPTQVLINHHGTLLMTPGWTGPDGGGAVAWGDVDSDGDLDLASDATLYLNSNGELEATPSWTASDWGFGDNVAWGDVDGDGDLDLAGGRAGIGIYENRGGLLETTAGWISNDRGRVNGLAWGDVDGDGDLDLASAAEVSPQIYLNIGGVLGEIASWAATDGGSTTAVAWGDADGDGDLDLAVGSSDRPNRVYFNRGGTLEQVASWVSGEHDPTYDLAWGDIDGDGDLDLAVANSDGRPIDERRRSSDQQGIIGRSISNAHVDEGMIMPDANASDYVPGANRIYVNRNGTLERTASWSDAEADDTLGLALGDVDGDGELDLATANAEFSPRNVELYLAGSPKSVPAGGSDLPLIQVQLPLPAADGGLYGPSPLLTKRVIPVSYTLQAIGQDTVGGIAAYYSFNGGGQWFRAVPTSGTQTSNLDAKLSYQVEQIPVDYEDISASGLLLPLGDDQVSAAIPISFTFSLFGQQYPELHVGSNGFLTVLSGQSSGCCAGRPIPTTDSPNGIIAGWWADLDPEAGGNIYYHTLGEAPHRRFVVQFDGVPHFSGASLVTMQFKLFEDNDNIEVHYLAAPSDGDLHVAGIENQSGRDGETFYQGTGALTTPTAVRYIPSLPEHVFYWDTFESGFFGRSDNVVLRFLAYPQLPSDAASAAGTFKYYDSTPFPIQRAYASSTTYPFQVRGTQVRVMKNGAPAENAIVYHLPAGQNEGAAPLLSEQDRPPFRTGPDGFLPGRGRLDRGDQLIALLPITGTGTYTLYHTSAPATDSGLDAYTVLNSGVQTLTVSADNALMLFNLLVSLEWDAQHDETFMSQLEHDFQRTSQILYDLTNGQAALGKVRVYHDKGYWGQANVIVKANNSQRPSAVMGGSVITPTNEIGVTGVITDAYFPGQVRIGPAWNRFGNPDGTLGEDWPRVLAHELGHYLLFLPDNYLGLNDDGHLTLVECQGSAMADPYDEGYSEFLTAAEWTGECQQTLADRFLGRSDWESIVHHYPWLDGEGVLQGPSTLPLAVTQIETFAPPTAAETLAAPFFNLVDDKGNAIAVPEGRGQAYLFRSRDNSGPTGDYTIPQGAPVGDLVQARGAAPGDRLCVYDYSHEPLRLGCLETIGAVPGPVTLAEVPGWEPQILVKGVATDTVVVTVTNVSESSMMVQLLPAMGAASPEEAMAPSGDDFVATVSAPDGAYYGHVRVWVPGSAPLKEMVVEYTAVSSLSGLSFAWGGLSFAWGDPGDAWGGLSFAWGGLSFAWGGLSFAWGAPVMSGDGQVSIFSLENPFGSDLRYTLQAMPQPPELPQWLTPVGQAYRVSGEGHVPESAILFRYLAREVPAGQEEQLRVYYSPDEGQTWQRLVSEVDPRHNHVSSMAPGFGVYALVSTVEMPPFVAGWNTLGYPVRGTRVISEALSSIEGKYTSVYNYDPSLEDPWRLYDGTVEAPFDALVNDLREMEFGHSYWLYATQAVTLYLGVEGATSAADQPADATSVQLPPATYYGWLTPTAEFTPQAGMAVIAEIDGAECGRTEVVEHAGRLAYRLQVQAENVSGTPSGCGAVGRTVSFRVGGWLMDHDREWDNRQAWYQGLQLKAGFNICLPYIVR